MAVTGDLFDQIQIIGDRVEVQTGPALRRYLPRRFWAEYPGVVLESLPVQVAMLPFLWTAAPIVWALGITLAVDELDERVAESLELVRARMAARHEVQWQGRILARHISRVEPIGHGDHEVAALYSGGLDSVAAILERREVSPLLVMIWGNDVHLENRSGWQSALHDAQLFAESLGCEIRTIRSNFKWTNDPELERLSPSGHDWYGKVAYGASLAGLTAPLLYKAGVSTLLVPGTFHRSYTGGHGSSPEIDDLISLGPARVTHQQSEMTRQDKVKFCVREVRALGVPKPLLRVCFVAAASGSGNCHRCEKCLRTIVGLVAAGEQPTAWGFERADTRFVAEIPALFAKGVVDLSADAAIFWVEIAHSCLEGAPVSAWLRGFDFMGYATGRQHSRGILGTLGQQLGRVPIAFALARRAKRRVDAVRVRTTSRHRSQD